MIPGANAISDSAISEFPASHYNDGVATLRCRFRFEAIATDPYKEFVRSTTNLTYCLEINRHIVPDQITT